KSPLAGPGFAAVGDAAGLVSPINGEGTAHALESGRQLASCLIGNFHSAASVNAALQSYTESMETAYSGYFRWSWAFHRFFGSYRRIRRLVARAGRDEQVAEALAGLLSNTSPPAALVKVRNAKLLI
ncbi:MAG: NAD(P)/FAD-dependent oxidoreductase, partial [Terriglobia bacterium]